MSKRLSPSSLLLSTSLALVSCADVAAADRSEARRGAIVYGADDRLDYFEVVDPGIRERLARSTVALIDNRWIDRASHRIATSVPTWGEAGALCPGERFADQPAVAFCTGTLVDWDLVLTAGHCARVAAIEDFSIVFGYYLGAPGQLAVAADDVMTPIEIVAEEWTGTGDEGALDYAWIRLAQPVPLPREPAPVYTLPPPFGEDGTHSVLVTVGAASGTPMKVDAGGEVLDRRGISDYFVANTDTSRGWSGGGAFVGSLGLAGILARGGPDLFPTDAGCQATQRAADVDGEEEYTYAHRSVQALCASNPEASTLCRPDCEQPCRALPFDPTKSARSAGCDVAPGPSSVVSVALVLLICAIQYCKSLGTGRRVSVRGRRVSIPSVPAGERVDGAPYHQTNRACSSCPCLRPPPPRSPPPPRP